MTDITRKRQTGSRKKDPIVNGDGLLVVINGEIASEEQQRERGNLKIIRLNALRRGETNRKRKH
jgi:hypothetical protein